jgi:hypothetical protein
MTPLVKGSRRSLECKLPEESLRSLTRTGDMRRRVSSGRIYESLESIGSSEGWPDPVIFGPSGLRVLMPRLMLRPSQVLAM